MIYVLQKKSFKAKKARANTKQKNEKAIVKANT